MSNAFNISSSSVAAVTPAVFPALSESISSVSFNFWPASDFAAFRGAAAEFFIYAIALCIPVFLIIVPVLLLFLLLFPDHFYRSDYSGYSDHFAIFVFLVILTISAILILLTILILLIILMLIV